MSFGIKTLISLATNIIIGIVFIMKMQGSIDRLEELARIQESYTKEVKEDMKAYRTTKDNIDATQDTRITVLESRMNNYDRIK